jgi:8-oxo-dGTP pyrophosphatase MutT (NUDIX family)
VRALIEQKLSAQHAHGGGNTQLLANVVGDVSAQLRAVLEQPQHRAAVLLALIEREGSLHVLLTERAEHLTHHPGQVSFPGGRVEATDDGPVAAALREAWEEVALPPAAVTVVGCLAQHATGTGFNVTPVVGFVAEPFQPKADAAEVSSVFEVPLGFVCDEANVRVEYRERFGSRFRVYEFDYAGYRIWGATASILITLRDKILEKNQ